MGESFSDRLPLSRSTLDRDAAARDEAAVLERARADPATRVAVLARGKALLARVTPPRIALLPVDAVPPGDLTLYLGRATETEDDLPAGALVLAVELDDAAADALEPDAGRWADLRLTGSSLSARDAGLFAQALGLANWHRVAGFSPRTGAPTVPGRAGWVRHPEGFEEESTGHHAFPRTDPAVIMGVIDADDRLLLAANRAWPEQRFSVLAGFVEPGESFEAAVRREVFEEVGVRVGRVEYLGSQPWPFPASVMVGFLAWVAPGASSDAVPDGTEIREARWFTREQLAVAAADRVRLPGRTSIARAIVEHWYGGTLPGDW